MTYLTGKRFEYRGKGGNAAGTTTGVIVSEPFREACKFYEDSETCLPVEWSTCVAILWDDGSMEGAIDIELLKVVEEKEDVYVVCATWPEDEAGEIILETYIDQGSLDNARKRAADWKFKNKKSRIAKLTFIDE